MDKRNPFAFQGDQKKGIEALKAYPGPRKKGEVSFPHKKGELPHEELEPLMACLTGLKDKMIDLLLNHVRSNFFKNHIPHYIEKPTRKLIDDCLNIFFITKTLQSGGKALGEEAFKVGLKNESEHIVQKLINLVHYIFPHLQFQVHPSDDDFDPKIHLSMSMYAYIRDFDEVFQRIVKFSVIDFGDYQFENKLIRHSVMKKMNPEQLLSLLHETPLYDFFQSPMPIHDIPLTERTKSLQIIAQSKHGKTQLLHHFILFDILNAFREEVGFCIIDSQDNPEYQTDLIHTISRLAYFDPQLENSLAEKLILIDPSVNPTSVNANIFQFDQVDSQHFGKDRKKMDTLYDALSEYVFNDFFSHKFISQQKAIVRIGATLLRRIPGANMFTFQDFLNHPEAYIRKHGGRNLSKIEVFDFSKTDNEIALKLFVEKINELLSSDMAMKMFGETQRQLDMFTAMDAGKIVLINTSKALIGKLSSFLGKIFIAQIIQGAMLRAKIPQDLLNPYYIYIDGGEGYYSKQIEALLSQIQGYKVGCHFTFDLATDEAQGHYPFGSKGFARSRISFVGRLDPFGSRYMSAWIKHRPEEISALKKIDQAYCEYFCHIHGVTPRGVKLKVPLGILNNQKRMPEASYQKLLEMNR